MSDPRYPIGPFSWPESISLDNVKGWIDEIESAPARLREAVSGLTDAQLDTPYREGGWTLRQVVHHLPDSHMNTYMRFKRALTEDTPTIDGYQQALWVELPDAKSGPIDYSLDLFQALHTRWTTMLNNMTPADFKKGFFHTEHQRTIMLGENTAMYAWHSNHHIAHITTTKKNQGW